nr:ERI1 exoribonuclease 3 isoform X2 [Pelodiscus sinensis]|eukprot:XP_025036265.1 ERI1 exoribonuclease 3 isoform X2 [Pelodiscus sinensis]
MLVTQASLFQVSDASGLSMVALFHTGAAKIPPSLLLRVRPALCSHRPRCFLQGCGSIVRRKLASHGFGASMAAMSSFPPQRYHYFLVLDFEATCDKPQIHPQEIIEFPILKLNGRTMEIESTFHMYVQPMVHPQLTPFCTELTGIIQGMVDGQPSLQQVLERVDEWMAKEGLLDPSVKSIFVTCGDWDLKVMLPGQCQYLGLPVADYFKQWINLKKAVLLSSEHPREAVHEARALFVQTLSKNGGECEEEHHLTAPKEEESPIHSSTLPGRQRAFQLGRPAWQGWESALAAERSFLFEVQKGREIHC